MNKETIDHCIELYNEQESIKNATLQEYIIFIMNKVNETLKQHNDSTAEELSSIQKQLVDIYCNVYKTV